MCLPQFKQINKHGLSQSKKTLQERPSSACPPGCKVRLFLFLRFLKRPGYRLVFLATNHHAVSLFPARPVPSSAHRSDTNLEAPSLNNALDSARSHLTLKPKSTFSWKCEIKQGSHQIQSAPPHSCLKRTVATPEMGEAQPKRQEAGPGNHVFCLLRTRQPKQKGGLPSPTPHVTAV